MKAISYFNKKGNKASSWNEITREERFFCFEFYQNLKKDITPFLSLMEKGINKSNADFLKAIQSEEFDIGVEVCFYRDLLKLHEISPFPNELSKKRTFDLALFSSNTIIIIEAKAQQGFDTKQLNEFKKDSESIKKLFKLIGHEENTPNVFLVALHSSRYKPEPKTIDCFHSIVKWNDLALIYKASSSLLQRANDIYRK